MATGSRTLKLSILGDVDNLNKSLKAANTDVENSSSKMGDFAKKAGLAFAAAGAAAAIYAGKLLIDGVKSALEDEAAQVRLANALRNTVGATDESIAAAEKYILKQSLATGVSDDELRPALERLTRSTKDIAEAQTLTNLALDIAKAKNIDVATVANALAKANDGQVGALKKLGITLGDNATNLKDYNAEQTKLEKLLIQQQFVLETSGSKSKEYAAITEKVGKSQGVLNELTQAGIDVFGELSKEFAGAAAESADTFQGKLARLNIAFEEGKETIGAFVLDAITPLVTIVVDKIVPAVESFINGLSGAGGLGSSFDMVFGGVKSIVIPIIEGLRNAFDKVKKTIDDNSEALQPFFNLMKSLAKFVYETLAPIIGGTLKAAFDVLGTVISVTISGFAKIVSIVTSVTNAVKAFIKLLTDNPVTRFFFGDSNSKSLTVSGSSGGDTGALVVDTGGMQTGGGFNPGADPYTYTGAPLSSYSPAMQAAILRREQLKAETEALRVARENAAAARLAATGGQSTATIVNQYFNAVVADTEAASRAVVAVLNDSTYRGTGGSSNLVTI